MNGYEVFEHTADIGVRIKGSSREELFKNAGLALFRISSRKQFTVDKTRRDITVKLNADDLEELFVGWLNELLSLSAAKGLIFHNIKINKLTDNSLEAVAVGSPVANYKVNTEIKAATYHELRIIQDESGWQAEVILDV